MAVTGAIVSAVAAVGGGVYSAQQQKKASEAQEDAQDLQQKRAEGEAYREKLKAMREARIKRAMVQNVAAQTGTAGSSGEAGSVSSIGSQLGGNISNISSGVQFGQVMGTFQKKITGYGDKAAMGQAVSGLGQQGLSMFGGSLFSTDGGTPPGTTEKATKTKAQ